jgi:hypothetical protein
MTSTSQLVSHSRRATETDPDLLVRLHREDRAAFGELYQQTAAILTRYVAARLRDRDRDAVEDMVQEAFCTALAEPHRLDAEAEAPADLLAAIAAVPAAQAMFNVLTKANLFALIVRVNGVKRAQTRERKIGEFVAMLARHETIYPQKAKPPNSP